MLNNNYQNILIKFSLWIATAILICIVGVSGVFADTYYTNYDTDLYYYDNRGSSISSVSTLWNESLQTYVSGNITTVAGSYGGAVGFSSPINILRNHTYTVSIYFLDLNNISLSSKNYVGIGTSPYSSCHNYATNNFKAETLMSTVTKNAVLTYSFKASDNASYICVPWTTTSNSTQTYAFNQIIIDDLGSSGVSQQQIDNSLNNQTNILNNSINNMQQNIINNQNQNSQDIINSNKACKVIDSSNIKEHGKYLVTSGNIFTGSDFGITDFINIQDGSLNIIETNSDAINSCFYNVNKQLIDSCFRANTLGEVSVPSDATYVRFSIKETQNKPQFRICQNGNQALNDSINDLNDSLNNDDSSGATSEASDFFSSFTTDTFGLTSIITAPLNLIQSLTSSSCSELHLPLPYLDNKYIDLPCMSSIYQTYFGSFFTIYQTITYGIIAYWVCVRIFNQVKDFKNPEHDEIEVVDL